MKNKNTISNAIIRSIQFSTKLLILSFVLFIFSGIVNAQTNVAKGKVARQSSTRAAGGAASRAVDGNKSGSFTNNSVTHTASATENGTWWEVDLGRVYNISQIKIYNRTDCCKDRLSNSRVKVSTARFSSNSGGALFADILNSSSSQSFVFNERTLGRYVRIYKTGRGVLSLAEVEVFGTPVNEAVPRVSLDEPQFFEETPSTKPSDTNPNSNNKVSVGNWNVYDRQGRLLPNLKAVTRYHSTGALIVTYRSTSRTAKIQDGKIYSGGIGNGTITNNGNRIVWSNGVIWTRPGVARLQNSNNQTNSNSNNNTQTNRNSRSSSNVRNITGNWIGYDSSGNRTAYVWQIRQSLGWVYVKNIGNNNDKKEFRGILSGRLITPDKLDVKATVSNDNKSISWTNGTYWIRQNSGNSSVSNSRTNLNTNKNSNPLAPRIKNVTGNWAGYFKDGRKSAYVWKISQNGSTILIKEISTSQNLVSKGRISGDQVYATDFKTKGKLSADGKAIYWSDGVIWRKQ